MSEKIDLSIVIPCYNVQNVVGDTIFSLSFYRGQNCEYIIINDGSKDNTLNVIKSSLETHKVENCKVFTINNLGLSGARNFGISKAKGKFIWFLDGDDVLTPTSVQEVISIIQSKSDIDLIAFQGFDFEDRKLDSIKDNYYPVNSFLIPSYNRELHIGERINSRLYILEMIRQNKYLSNACFYVMKTENLRTSNLKFKEQIIYEDVLFTILLFLNEKNLMIIQNRLILHRRRSGSIMRSRISRMHIKSGFIVVQELFKLMKEHSGIVELNILFQKYLYLILRKLRNNNYSIFEFVFDYFPQLFKGCYDSKNIRIELVKNLKFSIKRL